MKKLIAFAVAAIMVLSMIPAMAFTASADEAETNYPEPFKGFWTVYRDPDDYADDAEFYKPAPAYKYTSEGFQLTSADYTNMTPKWTVQSSRPVDLTQGFYMQFRVDEFSYKGEDGTADEWISLSISDRPLVAHGNTVHGNNWCSLIRGAGDGKAEVQSFITTMNTDDAKGAFTHKGSSTPEVPKDGDGKEIYTFAVIYDGTNYDIQVNGISVPGAADITTALKGYEECYVGLTFHSGAKNGVASATILKQGTSASDCETPDGTDEGPAEDNVLVYGPQIDINTIEKNQPALLWNANKTSFVGDPGSSASGVVITPTADMTYHLAASGTVPYFMWSIKSALTFEAKDIPVFAMLMKNYMGNDGSLRYCTGDILSADDVHLTSWGLYDDDSKFYGENEEYSLVVVNLGEVAQDWEGRLNSIRPEFSVDASDDEWSEWDIEYMAMFRTVEEAHAYTEAYLAAKGVSEETGEETDPPVGESDTDGQETNGDDTVADTTDGKDTSSGDKETSADTDGSTKADTKNEKDPGGCASVIGVSAALIVAAAAAVVLKKKD